MYFNEFSKCLQPVKKELEILGKYRELDQLKKIEAWLVQLAQQEHTEEEAIFFTIVVAGSIALYEKFTKADAEKKSVLGMKAVLMTQELLELWKKRTVKPGSEPAAREKEYSFADVMRYRSFVKNTGGGTGS